MWAPASVSKRRTDADMTSTPRIEERDSKAASGKLFGTGLQNHHGGPRIGDAGLSGRHVLPRFRCIGVAETLAKDVEQGERRVGLRRARRHDWTQVRISAVFGPRIFAQDAFDVAEIPEVLGAFAVNAQCDIQNGLGILSSVRQRRDAFFVDTGQTVSY